MNDQLPLPEADEPEATRRRRGCVRPVVWSLLIGLTVLLLVLAGVWIYTGTSSFEALVARRIEATLEARMGRDVRIGNIEITRGRLTSVILEDVRIANVEGASHPWFAIIPRIVIEGGVESFRQRVVEVGSIEIHGAEMFLEMFPEGHPLDHNFPEWKRGEPARFEIAEIRMREIEVFESRVVYLDHRRELDADVRQISATIEPNMEEGIFSGMMLAESAILDYRDWDPVRTSIRTGFHFQDRQLTLRGTRVRSDGIRLDAGGRIVTAGNASYTIDVEGNAALDRVMEILNVEQEIEGAVTLEVQLSGEGGSFALVGTARSDELTAAGYQLDDLIAALSVTEEQAEVDIEQAGYAGGTVTGTWLLSSYEEPRPMTVDLRYDGVSLEGLLADWNVEASGLRGSAQGQIHYEFVADDFLSGTGSGTAILEPGATAFGDAPHPMNVAGRTAFTIDEGVLRFGQPSVLRLPETTVQFSGTLALEDLRSDIDYSIESGDFTVLDRLAVNFGRAFGSSDFELLGLGGTGTISGSVSGLLSEPVVNASIDGRNVEYNDVPVGRARIALSWNGSRETLSFEQATFTRDGATLDLGGSIRFPESGGPVFDLTMDASSWLVSDALDLVDLELEATGQATGQLTVVGTPDRGTVTFQDLEVRQGGGMLALNGPVDWLPGEGNVTFALDVHAEAFPVSEVTRFLDIEAFQFETAGLATGDLRVEGSAEQGTVNFQDLSVRQNGSRLALNGLLRWLPGEGNLEFDLDVATESYPVRELIAFLDLGELPLEGDLTGTLHLEGPLETLGGAGSVTLRDGSIAGEPIQEAVADLRFDAGELDVRHFEVISPAGTLVGEATYDLETGEFSYLLQPTTIDLSKIEALADFDFIQGMLEISSSGAGTAESPEIVVDAILRSASILGTPIPEDVSPPQLYLAIRDGQLVVRGSAFDALTVSGQGNVGPEGQLSGQIDLAVSDLSRVMEVISPGESSLQGSLRAELDLGGTIESIETIVVNGTVTELDLLFGGEPIVTEDPIQFALRDGRVLLDSVAIRAKGTDFFVDGSIALVDQQQIDLEIRGDVNLSIVEIFMGDAEARGSITVRADIDGTLESPRIRGTAELRDASLKLAAFPQLISNIYGSFILRGDRIEIDSFQATVGGGSIVAGGFVTLQGFEPGRIRVNAQGTDVTLRTFEGVTFTGDMNLILSGDVERLQLQGDVIVDRAVYYDDFDLTQLILERVLERQAVVPDVADTWQDNVALRIEVTADDTLAIQNNVADVTGSADLDITGTLANPIILGRVTLNEGGAIEFQDVDYRLVQGTISFQNPFRNDPYFDITAEGTISSRGQSLGEIEEYELTVNLTGTIDRITPNISSDPPVGDLTLLTLLSGSLGGQGTALGGQSFSQAGTSLILSQVGEAIGAKILPFADAVRLDTVGESGFNPTVTFEKQISSDIFVIVIYDTASTENIEIVQWQATDDWVIQFTRDSEADSYLINAIDARFRRRYEGRW